MNLKYRPLALTGFTVLIVLILSIFVYDGIAVVSAACGALIFIISMLVKKIRDKVYPFFIAAALILGSVLFTVRNDYDLKYALSFVDTEESSVEGEIYDFPVYSNQRYYYTVKTYSINSKKCETLLRLSLPNEIDAKPYDIIKADVTVYVLGNSAGEDVERYYRSKGVFLGAYVYNSDDSFVDVTETDSKPFRYSILSLRKSIEERILDKLPNEYGGTATALLLGDKSFISDETKNELYEVGIAPVFAVSGLHLSIWIMGLFEILQQLGVRKRINAAISIAFTLFFMALTGFSPSVCRSGLMMILLLIGHLMYRRTDSLNSLGFSALVLCCINPFIAADTSFLLSFTATLGIVTLYPLVEKYVIQKINNRFIKMLLSAIFVSVTAIIGSLPATVFLLESLSVFAVVTNLLVTFAAAFCMVMAGFTAVLFKVKFISDMTAFFCGIAAKYILQIIHLFSRFPVTAISTADLFWKGAVIFCVAVIVFALIFFKGKTAFKFSCIGLSVVIAASSVASYFYYDGLTRLEVLDVGDGIAVTVAYEGRKILLMNKCDSYNTVFAVEDSLKRISRKDTNMLLLAYKNAAECGSTLQILKENDFYKIVLPQKSNTLSSFIDRDKIMKINNSTINVWDNGKIEFFSGNEISYAYCTFDTVTFLIVFSADKNTNVNEKYLKADFLICNGYIPDNVNPSNFDCVVLSTTGKKKESITNYVTRCGGRTVCTADKGSILFKIRNSEYKISVKEG